MVRKTEYEKKKIEANIADDPFLAIIYSKKGYVEKFHTLEYEEQMKAYQTLAKLASDSNTNEESKFDAFKKLKHIMRSIGLEFVEKQDYYLSKDERMIIRMDFYGTIDRMKEGERKRKLSKPYLDLMANPLKKRPKMADYDFNTAPMWPLFARFKSFRRIEKNLKQYLVKNKVDPKILSLMNIRDFSDLIVQTFEKDNSDLKIEFQKPISVRKNFVKSIAEEHGDEIEAKLLAKGYDRRYILSMLNAMRRFGATKTDKLIITEINFTDRTLKELRKNKIECKGYKKGDPIPQDLIDYLIDNNKGDLIAAYDNEGHRLYGPEFPSFEVHHKHAVSSGGDLSNIASINYKDNLCLVLEDIHSFVLHGMDIVQDDKRDAYSRRTEFIDDDVIFMAGLEQTDQIHCSYINTSGRKKHEKEDSRIHVSYNECLAKLEQNQENYMSHHMIQKRNKKVFDVDAVVAMVNESYNKKGRKRRAPRKNGKGKYSVPMKMLKGVHSR